MPAPLRRLKDHGQSWVQWDPERAFTDARLADAVSMFEPMPNPAGQAAATWLREDALANHGLTLTYLVLLEFRVHGFYSMRASEIQLSTRDQHQVRARHPRQAAALVVWIARRAHSPLTGEHLLAHAVARARLAQQYHGLLALALDPFDPPTEKLWRNPPYRFRASQTRLPNGTSRLWRAIDGFDI